MRSLVRLTLPATGLLVVLTLAAAAGTAGAAAAPAAGRHALQPLAAVARQSFVAVPAEELAAEDARRDAEGLPFRFALPVDLALTPANSGTWEDVADGRRVWRLRLASPGALSLNLGLGRCLLPPTALLHVYPAADPGRAVRLDDHAGAAHGQVWTPVLLADEIVLELEVPAAHVPAVDLEVTRLGRGYRFFGETPDKSGLCNINVVCPAGDPWRDEIDTVAMYALNGSELCTGFLVNNTALDGRPLFMSANHCNLTRTSAPTLVAYWNYQSPTCEVRGGGDKSQFTTGATFLARYAASDFSLAELDEVPPASFGVKYAGWDRRYTVPDSAVCIHHPSTDEKSISFDRDALMPTFYLGTATVESGDHLRVIDWDLGTTEGGSSGSPLFDPQHRVVGQLHGGRAACSNDLSDWYGRLAASWEGGGADTTRVRDHLDPLGTGAETLDLLDPADGRFAVEPGTPVEFGRVDGGDLAPPAHFYTLSNTGLSDVEFSLEIDVDWLDADTAGGVLAVDGERIVMLTPNAAALDLPLGRHTAVVTFTNEDGGPGTTTREVILLVAQNVLSVRGAVPNPFTDLPVEIRYTLLAPATVRASVTDIRGRHLRDLGRFAGDEGVNALTWDGRTDDGRLVPSGLYVVAVEGLGRVERVRVTFVH